MSWLLLLACTGDSTGLADSVLEVPDSVDTGPEDSEDYTGLSSEGDRSCVISPTGSLACFEVTESAWSRSQDTPAGAFSHVSAGGCGLKSGVVSCWDPDEHGTADPPAGDFTTVERGGGLACAPDDIGRLTCWGDTSGLGDALGEARIESHLSVSGNNVCGLAAAGTLVCDGAGVTGVPGGEGHLAVDAGAFGCAVDEQGALVCWGSAAVGPPAGDGWVDLAVGDTGVCARDLAGLVSCAGTGAFAVVPEGLPRLTALDAGRDHVCGLDEAGTLVCWLADGAVVTEAP